MRRDELFCDRCDQKISGSHLTITVNYHHPVTLDLCELCGKTIPFWLGQTPGGTSLDAILAGDVSGTHIPTSGQIEVYRESGTVCPAPVTGSRT